RAGDVELAVVVQRPAAMAVALDRADILGKLRLALRLALAQEPVEENIFRRDRCIGLELEDEMPVGLLQGGKRLGTVHGDVAGMRSKRRRGGNLGHVDRGGTRCHRWKPRWSRRLSAQLGLRWLVSIF